MRGNQPDWQTLCERYPYLARITRSGVRQPAVPKQTPEWILLALLSAIRYSGFGKVLASLLLELMAEDIVEICLRVLEESRECTPI